MIDSMNYKDLQELLYWNIDRLQEKDKEIEKLRSIIKEVREKIRYWQQDYMETYISTDELDDILEILDKASDE